ncbi:MAG: hypothetical protein JXC32_07535 [Anaerolineae bacterium]|nr:hypothetical protein [Anaerolineae bacterium]
MQHTIYIRDELVLRAHLEGDSPHTLLRREGESGAVRIQVNEVRYLADAMLDMAAQIAGQVVGDDE